MKHLHQKMHRTNTIAATPISYELTNDNDLDFVFARYSRWPLTNDEHNALAVNVNKAYVLKLHLFLLL